MPGFEAHRLAREQLTAFTHRVVEEIAEPLAPLEQEIIQQLNAIASEAAKCPLEVAIIGAEGHGKSTLINSLLACELTPADRLYPGTMAPIQFAWHAALQPGFAVRSATAPKQDSPVSRDRFWQLLLQRYRAENPSPVISGTVFYNHPLLHAGLRLHDLPGVEGVSPAISEATRQFLRAGHHSLILVARDRRWGAVHRVLDELQIREDRLCAVVVNCDSDYFDDQPSADLSDRIEEQRNAARQVLDRDVPTFVFHVPSLAGAKSSRFRGAAVDVYARESERFLAHIMAYIEYYGSAAALAPLRARLRSSIAELKRSLRETERRLSGLLGGDANAKAAARADFEAAAQDVKKGWAAQSAPPIRSQILERSWTDIRNALIAARDELNATARGARRTAGRNGISYDDVIKMHRKLTDEISRCNTAMSRKQAQWIESVSADLQKRANTLLRMADIRVVAMSAAASVAVAVHRYRPVLALGPPSSELAFVDIFSNRTYGFRIVDRFLAQVRTIDTSESGPCRKAVEETWLGVTRDMNNAIESSLSDIFAYLEPDRSRQIRLEVRLADIRKGIFKLNQDAAAMVG